MSKRSKANRDIFVARPFEGLIDEPQWIAVRELVPAATAPLALVDQYASLLEGRSVTLVTILPMAAPVMVRQDGRILLAAQRHQQSGDVSRDLAASLLAALTTPTGVPITLPGLPGQGPRLQDVLKPEPLDLTLHQGFDFWLDQESADDPAVRASCERANASLYPTVALAAASAAYWCRVSDRAHVRWVLPEDEDLALNALSRTAAARTLRLGDHTKFAGMFRAHGRLIPVWDVPNEAEAKEWETPLAEFAERYAEALSRDDQLSPAERRSRQGLLGRQLTLR